MSISPTKTIKFPSKNDISELERRDGKGFGGLNYKFVKSANNKFFAVFARKEKLCAWIYKIDETGSYREKYYIEEFPFDFTWHCDTFDIALENEGKYLYLARTKDGKRIVYCFSTEFCSSVEFRLQWSVILGDEIDEYYRSSSAVIIADNRKNIFVSAGNGKVFMFNHNSPENQTKISTQDYIDYVDDMKLANGSSMLIVSGHKRDAENVGTILSVDLSTFQIKYAFQANSLLGGLPVSNIFCSSTNLFYLDYKGIVHLHNLNTGIEVFKTKYLGEHIDTAVWGHDIFYKYKHLFIQSYGHIYIFSLKGDLIGSIYIKGMTSPMVIDYNSEQSLFVVDKTGVLHYDFELKAKTRSTIDYKLGRKELDCDIYGFQDLSYYPDKEHLHLISNRKEFIIDIASGKWKQVEDDELYEKKSLSKHLTTDKYLLADYDEEHVFIQNLKKNSNFELEFDFVEYDDDDAHAEYFVPYFSPDHRFFALFLNKRIKIFDLARQQQLQDIPTPVHVSLRTISLSPCLPIAASHTIQSGNLKFHVWDLSNGDILFSKNYSEFSNHDIEGCIHAFSPCGKYVLVVTLDFIYQYDLKGNLILKRKNAGNEGSSESGSIYFISKDGYFVTGIYKSQVWHIDKEEPLYNIGKDFTYQKMIPLNNNRFVFWNNYDINIISSSVNTSPIVALNEATPSWHKLNATKEANELEVRYIRNGILDNQNGSEAAQKRRLDNERLEYIKTEEQREEERELAAYRRQEQDREEEQRIRRERDAAESRRKEEEEESLRKEREEQERTYTLEEIWNQSAGGVKMNALSACYYHQADGRCSYRDRDDWCNASDGQYSNCWETDSLDHCIKSEIGDKPREW